MILMFGTLLAVIITPIIWVDHKTQIIPNGLTFLLALSAIMFQFVVHPELLKMLLVEAIVIFGLFAMFRKTYAHFRHHQGLGFGDVKLLGAATLWVGILAMPQVLLIASTTGLIYLIFSNKFGHAVTKTTRIAFGPHICFGLVIVWWAQEFFDLTTKI